MQLTFDEQKAAGWEALDDEVREQEAEAKAHLADLRREGKEER